MSLRVFLANLDPDILMLPKEFDRVLVGFVQVAHRVSALYDREGTIDVLMKKGMTADAANEYFEINIVGAYVGDYTPAFSTVMRAPYVMDFVECPVCFEGVESTIPCTMCKDAGCESCLQSGLCGPCSVKMSAPEAQA